MTFANIFSEGVVLQRGKPIRVWGAGPDGSLVRIRLGDNSAETAVREGRWEVTLPAMEAATGLTLTGEDGNDTLQIENVAVGEVWLAGGQSNMEFMMKWDAERETVIPATIEPNVRFYRVPKLSYPGQELEEDHSDEGIWRQALPGDTEYFSAVGLYFALRLREALGDIPVGIVDCNWGGSSAACWMDDRYFTEKTGIYLKLRERIKEFDYEQEFAAFKARNAISRSPEAVANLDKVMSTPATAPMDTTNPPPGFEHFLVSKHFPFSPFSAGCLYRTMLSKIIGFGLRGFLWYQGEEDSDAAYGMVYDELLPAMIRCWRDGWGEELPFLFVQLAGFTNPGGIMDLNFTALRAQQDWISKTVPNCWMAVSYDAGHQFDIHPKYKRPVGQRLALQALANVYGLPVRAESPDVAAAQVEEGGLTVRLLHTAEGLCVHGETAKGLTLRVNGAEAAPASVEVSGDRITVRSEKLRPGDRVELGYAWTGWCETNLYNSDGLPVRPFRVIL